MNGTSPKNFAPNLYLKARFKRRSICQELHNGNWIRNLKDIDSPLLLQEFVLLFMALADVNLTDEPDVIKWRWTSNGKYTVASAYEIQFKGAAVLFPATEIWRAITEPKCCFFGWLVMHNKVLTADNMAKRNWPCNLSCVLCYCQHETTAHMLTKCNFTEATWNLVASQHQLPTYTELMAQKSPTEIVTTLLSSGNAKDKRRKVGVLCTFWWEVWKERNRRVFDRVEKSPNVVAALTLEALKMVNFAYSL